jgi:GNAT superfamily N-acetyltransferase
MTTTVAIRSAVADDRMVLQQLRSQWTAEGAAEGTVETAADGTTEGAAEGTSDTADPEFAARFASWFDHESEQRTFWLAEDAGRAVGMLNLLVVRRMPRPGHVDQAWGYLGNLYVQPERRRQGVGTLLVDAALGEAMHRGLVRLVLHANAGSLPFWRSRAFSETGDLWVRELP